VRSYWAVLSARARLLFQYRAAAAAGIATQLFWGVMRVMIFTAFYAHASLTQEIPLTLQQTVTYLLLCQVFLSTMPWTLDIEVEQMLRTGSVVYELVKPLDLYNYWYARTMAMRCVPLVVKGIPLALLSFTLLDLSLPPSVASGILFLLALAGVLFLSAAFTTLVMISLFWTIVGDGIIRLLPAIMLVFTGMLVPLPFYPDWLQPLFLALPFRGLLDTPLRLYTGSISPEVAFGPLLHQWVWTIALIGIGRWLVGRATQRLVVHGG
jgi:ABC-2 type transport system permease protein